MLYDVVRSELETFLVRAQASGRSVPAFVEREMRAFLVDRVLPVAPVRQWVLSLSFALRYRPAFDSKLAAAPEKPRLQA